MKKVFSIAICILLSVVLIMFHNSTKEIDNVIQLNVIDAKYDDGFIIIELEDSEDHKTIEQYSIKKIAIINTKDKNSYIKKYFNIYGKLLKVELFYNNKLI